MMMMIRREKMRLSNWTRNCPIISTLAVNTRIKPRFIRPMFTSPSPWIMTTTKKMRRKRARRVKVPTSPTTIAHPNRSLHVTSP